MGFNREFCYVILTLLAGIPRKLGCNKCSVAVILSCSRIRRGPYSIIVYAVIIRIQWSPSILDSSEIFIPPLGRILKYFIPWLRGLI